MLNCGMISPKYKVGDICILKPGLKLQGSSFTIIDIIGDSYRIQYDNKKEALPTFDIVDDFCVPVTKLSKALR